tara:strand:+ start:2201 stop:2941 length:741 start_codon:yes stop_codon:yes gene_type:complete
MLSITDAIKADFKQDRIDRQINNEKIVYDSIKTSNKSLLYKNINKKALNKIIIDLKLNLVNEFIDACNNTNNDYLCILSSKLIAKCATKQGAIDEKKQINICKYIGDKCNINIVKLKNNEIRPTKDGKIISKNEMKKNNIKIDKCLKSFDSKFSGQISGYITQKIVYDNGGHQDNVFAEIYKIADWWKEHKNKSDEILIALIETNLTKEFSILKNNYLDINNILFIDHYNFQLYMIENYSKLSQSI